MASKLFDFDKIITDAKSKPRKEPPKYIYEKNPRNNRKVKKLNPRWTAWSKRQKDKKIDKQVDKYVKDRKVPINKDLTKDNSKKSSDTLKVNKKEEKPKSNGSTTTDTKTEAPKTETPKTETPKKEAPKKKTNREKFNERFIRTKGGKLARRGTVGARRAENKEAARKRAQAAAKLRIKKKKAKTS
jgi:hypothetical protein